MSRGPALLVLGGSGQIGHELVRELASCADVAAPGHDELDVCDEGSIRPTLDALHPAIVINAAAYTAVARAEHDREAAMQLNGAAPTAWANGCRDGGVPFVHLSTDYVFDGSATAPYTESAPVRPLSEYGRTKAAGEAGVRAAGGAYLILRTAWVYSDRRTNFARTICRLSRERDEIAVVRDQMGAPTAAADVARALGTVLRGLLDGPDVRQAAESVAGIYHLTAAGETTWNDFAEAILASEPDAERRGRCRVRPVASAEFGGEVARPAFSVLDCGKLERTFGVRLDAWDAAWQRHAAAVWSSV